MICIQGENSIYIWRDVCACIYMCVCVHVFVVCIYVCMYVCVCIYIYIYIFFFIVNLGKAVLRKIMMYFIPDKRILSTSYQALEA